MKKKNQGKTKVEQKLPKDGQKGADAHVLGQILAAQNVIFALPDAIRIAEFYSQTLLSIPGITACRVCLANGSVQAGEMENTLCAECEAPRRRSSPDTVVTADPNFKCDLVDRSDIRVIPIDSYQHHFGFFVFEIDPAAGFNAYQPFINNLSNYVAITFENRLQKELLQKAHHELERRVEERTRDLIAANEELQREIAERTRTEEALSQSKEQIKRLIDVSPVAMVVSSGTEEHVEWVNDKFIELFGYTAEDIPDVEHWWPLAYPDETYREKIKAQWNAYSEQAIQEQSQIKPLEATVKCKNGSFRHVEFRSSSIGEKHIVTFVDLTERKQAEDELRQNREATLQFSKRLAVLQEVTNELSKVDSYDDLCLQAVQLGRSRLGFDRVSIWFIEEQQGVMRGSFGTDEHGELRDERDSQVEFRHEGLGWFLYSHKESMALVEHLPLRDHQGREVGEGDNALAALWDGNDVIGIIYVDNLFTGQPIREDQLEVLRMYATTLGHLITRKRAGEALRASENRFRVLSENAFVGIYIIQDGLLSYVNSTLARIFGYTPEELTGAAPAVVIHPDDRAMVSENIRRRITGEVETVHYEFRGQCKNGEFNNIEVLGGRVDLGGKMAIIGNLMDVTERKRHELERESIITVSTTLRQATTKADILNVILDQLMDLFKADGAVLVLPDPQTKGLIDKMVRGPVGERMLGLTIPPDTGVSNWVIKNKQPYLNNHADQDPVFYRPDLLGESHCLAAVPLIAQEQSIGALWIACHTNISEQDLGLLNAIAGIAANAIHRVTLHEQTVLQLHHLMALHQIDVAISANFDLNVTLNVILKNVKDELEVDATSILLLNSVTYTLDYAAGAGFRTPLIENSQVRIGDGYAGLAAQTYRTVFSPDLSQDPERISVFPLLAAEEFLSHYATPLIVKGQVKGVLEVFHREAFDADREWINYFETLATQAAIAIENASLFENLQRSNMELMLAYDATIEGWSRALDLRDKETEGHTQRVTEMVLTLAEKLGMSDMEKTDLRRGALLHDIGKMGIPDSVLLKPGPLSESEWEIMRQHPNYALQMLSPISYLKRALDIPYCHHEKWDGSGYPRGLKGETIPLSARLFSIVDVYDALTSDRPYRAAWSREKVYHYIQEQSGTSFDPHIVQVFLKDIE